MPRSDLQDPLLYSDLDEEIHDRHDFARAQTSDHSLQIMWWVYAASLSVFSLGIMLIFFGILLNEKVRRNPFHKYILFLSFPDFCYSFLCAVTCLLSAIDQEYTSWWMCQFQVMYLYFGASANSWLNGCMAWEVHRLLKSSQIRKKYYPPTDKQVYRNCFICYVIALIPGSIMLISDGAGWENVPSSGILAGFTCNPAELTVTSTLVFWFVLTPLVMVIPYSFATYFFLDVVWWSKLLPPQGLRRDLAIYFFRIAAMFVFLWTPTFITFFAFKRNAHPWSVWGSGLFSHSQGLISALLTLFKPEIRNAVVDLIRHPWRLLCCSVVRDVPGSRSSLWTEQNTGSFALQKKEQERIGLPVQGDDFQFSDESRASTLSRNSILSLEDGQGNGEDHEETEEETNLDIPNVKEHRQTQDGSNVVFET